MSGPLNSLATIARKIDPVSKKIGLTGQNIKDWSRAAADPLQGLRLQREGRTPLWRVMAKSDALGNKLNLYGKNAPTPWDPLGRKMGLYGYDVVGDKTDWGSVQYTADQMQDPNFNFQNQQRAAAADEKAKTTRSQSGKMLFGE